MASQDSQTIVRRKVYRTGVQTLIVNGGGQFYVRCQNRTYDSGLIPIEATRVPYWLESFDEGGAAGCKTQAT